MVKPQANLSRLLGTHVVEAGRVPMEIVRGALRGAPDLAIEIASPSESAVDLDEKVAGYLAAGTQIVSVVYDKTRHIMAHYQNGRVQLFAADQTQVNDILPIS